MPPVEHDPHLRVLRWIRTMRGVAFRVTLRRRPPDGGGGVAANWPYGRPYGQTAGDDAGRGGHGPAASLDGRGEAADHRGQLRGAPAGGGDGATARDLAVVADDVAEAASARSPAEGWNSGTGICIGDVGPRAATHACTAVSCRGARPRRDRAAERPPDHHRRGHGPCGSGAADRGGRAGMIALPPGARVWLANGVTDMRKG